jgi:nicotinate phosphoribosyltransferase
MDVSADAPYLDMAYKLVEYAGRKVMKLSHGKVTAPGRKQVFRRQRPFGDVVGLFAEPSPAGRQPLLEPLMTHGRRAAPPPSIAASKRRFEADLALLPEGACKIRSPRAPAVRQTERLTRAMAETRARLTARKSKAYS